MDRDLFFLLAGAGLSGIAGMVGYFLRLQEDRVKRDRDRQEAERILWNKSLLNLEHGHMISEVLKAQGMTLDEAAKAMPDEQHRELRKKWDGDPLQRAMDEESRRGKEWLEEAGFSK